MIQLRDIKHDELSNLSELCLRSKAVWGYDDAFMTACRNELTLRPDDLQTSHFQVAERAAIAVGLVQIKVVGRDAELMKLFVEPALFRCGHRPPAVRMGDGHGPKSRRGSDDH